MRTQPEGTSLNPERAFELLEQPERWPDDPRVQAELAALLELHLALQAEGVARQVVEGAPRPVSLLRRIPWLMSAAAALLFALPLGYYVVHSRELAREAGDRARIQELAQRRGQDRLWADFFQQSSRLIQNFNRQPMICDQKNAEDHAEQVATALALLQASHGLAAQSAPMPGAEAVRADLHAWLQELSMEDPCMDPQRAEELRQWANGRNLEDEAENLSQLLKERQR